MNKKVYLYCIFFVILFISCRKASINTYTVVVSSDKDTITKNNNTEEQKVISVGANTLLQKSWRDLLRKRIGLVVNHTALVGDTHLVDTLQSLGLRICTVFAPEHGFRGDADAGETIVNGRDTKSGVEIISLYGKMKKPSPVQMDSLDILIFDIQDVGARFYTYISTLHYVMEACAESGKTLWVLDRPNPNGDYVDGCVREPKFASFVGMHSIPIVHGLTVAELAQMINGERWLAGERICTLRIFKTENYQHTSRYSLPVKPSPNLPNDLSVRLYPSLCLFEGTALSVGRGTDTPFQIFGAPVQALGDFSFVPRSTSGAKQPKYQDKRCYGVNMRDSVFTGGFTLRYLISMYQKYPDKDKFFTGYFDTLAGTSKLRQMIQAGKTEAQIRATWHHDLEAYKRRRARYLLYP